MTITPENFDRYIEPISELYETLEDDLFSMIVQRLKKGDIDNVSKDNVLAWQIEKLSETRAFNAEVIRKIADRADIEESTLFKVFETVTNETIETTDKQLSFNLFPSEKPPLNNLDIRIRGYVNQAKEALTNFVNQTLITTNFGIGSITEMYQRIVTETTTKVIAGNKMIKQALAETVIKWRNEGLDSGFVDKGGKRWSLQAYAKTVLRSTTNNAYNEITFDRMRDHNKTLVLVSSHSGARPMCARAQGKVLTIENSHPRYDSVYDYGYGRPDGLRGINCRHRLTPFVEGVNVNNQRKIKVEDADRVYKLQQKQRYFERQIRKAKSALMMAEQVGDETTIQNAKRKLKDKQADIREFIKKHDELRRNYDNEKVY